MMHTIRQWLLRFLPALAREAARSELDALRRELAEERQQSARLKAYIKGLQYAMRCGAREEPTYGNDSAGAGEHGQ